MTRTEQNIQTQLLGNLKCLNLPMYMVEKSTHWQTKTNEQD